jgi:hypothetical protein
MIDPPAPERRYQNGERQRFYEAGWRQEYDHDGFAKLDRIEHAVNGEPDHARPCELRAAMLEGARDALLELVDRRHDGAVFARALRGGDGV